VQPGRSRARLWFVALLTALATVISGWLFLAFVQASVGLFVQRQEPAVSGWVILNAGVVGYLFVSLATRLLRRDFATVSDWASSGIYGGLEANAGRFSEAGRTLRTSSDAAEKSAAAKVLRKSPSALTNLVKSGPYKAVGRVLPFAGAAISLLGNLVEGRSVGASIVRTVGSVAGGIAGAAVGDAACAAAALTVAVHLSAW
jgi:hypothetical protein